MRWTSEALFEALGRYEQVCISAGMRQNAINSYRWGKATRPNAC